MRLVAIGETEPAQYTSKPSFRVASTTRTFEERNQELRRMSWPRCTMYVLLVRRCAPARHLELRRAAILGTNRLVGLAIA